MPIVLPAYRQDRMHNFKEHPQAQEILSALLSLTPEAQSLEVAFDEFLTLRSFMSYVRRHYRGEYKFKNVVNSSPASCKVTKRREKSVREKYGLKKRRLFLAVIDSFVTHGLVHYNSQCLTTCTRCGHSKAQENIQTTQEARTQIQAQRAPELDRVVEDVSTSRPHVKQVEGVYRAAENLGLAIITERIKADKANSQ